MSEWNSIFSFVLPTKIVFGAGCAKSIGEELQLLGARKPLVITDPGIVKAGVLERALPKGLDCVIFDGVEANPKDRNVTAGALAYERVGADSLLAIGGGSPIDCAKAIGVLIANASTDIKLFAGKSAAAKPIPPLVAVPTTAGTGSELTFSAVITDTAAKNKFTVKNAYTAARVAICDPALTLSVPPAITAATGMDALTHAIEAFSVNCAEPLSDAAALYAIELIYQSLALCFTQGDNLAARSQMLMGSMLAGIAFSHADVGSVHCISEALGGMYDLPHGVTNAVILPHMMRYNIEFCVERYARVARAMCLTPDTGLNGALCAVEAVEALAAEVKLPSFGDLRVNAQDFAAIAAASARNISTQSNPRPMSEAEYLAVLHTMAAH